jgi:hypothetical protein
MINKNKRPATFNAVQRKSNLFVLQVFAMPKIVKPLTSKEISSAISQATKANKEKWLNDGGGLTLKIGASGHAKYWLRYRHPITKTQQYRELGENTPLFGLAEARKLAAQERDSLREGIDPNEAAAQRIRTEQAKNEAALLEKARIEVQITVDALFQRWAATDLIRRKRWRKGSPANVRERRTSRHRKILCQGYYQGPHN